MAKAKTRCPPASNTDIKLAIAKWKIYTGNPQYKLAEELGIDPTYFSQIVRGIRPGKKYVARIYEITERAVS